MTKQEIMSEPQYLDKYDIMDKFRCGRDSALIIIRRIKSVSDIAGLKGKITVTDYANWYNQQTQAK